MKLKGDFELVDVDQFEKKVIAHGETEARLGKILEQSESVNYIFQFLMEETTEDDVVKNMVETFEADEADIRADVHSIICGLRQTGYRSADGLGRLSRTKPYYGSLF